MPRSRSLVDPQRTVGGHSIVGLGCPAGRELACQVERADQPQFSLSAPIESVQAPQPCLHVS